MTLDRVTTSLEDVQRLASLLVGVRAESQALQAELVQAMREAYGPFTHQEIGDAAGISRERVRQLLLKEEK